MRRNQDSIEILLSNIVDPDIQAVLKPLDLMQFLFLMAKYKILHNFITPIWKSYYIFSLFGTLLYVFVHYKKMSRFFFLKQTNIFLLFFEIFNFIFYSICFVIYFVLNIFNSLKHISLILRLQEVHRTFKFQEISLMNLKIRNWATFSSLLLAYSAILSSMTPFYDWNSVLYFLTFILFDASVIYASSLMVFINKEISLWIHELHLFVELSAKFHLFKIYEIYDDDKSYWRRLHRAYVHLLHAFRIYTEVFRFPVFLFALDAFTHSLLYVQMHIELAKMNIITNDSETGTVLRLVIGLWLTKNLAALMMLGLELDAFYHAVTEVETMCACNLQRNQSEAAKKVLKNIQRLNRVFDRMTGYRMFEINSGLPVQIICLVMTYSVVLLQFALQA